MCPLETGLGTTFDEEVGLGCVHAIRFPMAYTRLPKHFGHFKTAVDYITAKGACTSPIPVLTPVC